MYVRNGKRTSIGIDIDKKERDCFRLGSVIHTLSLFLSLSLSLSLSLPPFHVAGYRAYPR